MTPAERSIPEVLRAAADLIEPEGAWTQGWSARTARGAYTHPTSPLARCWCGVGAILAVGGSDEVLETSEIGLPDTIIGGLRPLSYWNDTPGRLQAEVVAKLREAADLYEATHNPGERHGG